MDIVHAVMEATNETVVSVHDNTVSRCVERIAGDEFTADVMSIF